MTFRSKPAMGYSPPSNPRRRGWQLRALSRLTGRCTASKFDKSEWRSGIDTAAALPPSLDSGDGSAGSTPIPTQESDIAELIGLVAHPDLVALQVGADHVSRPVLTSWRATMARSGSRISTGTGLPRPIRQRRRWRRSPSACGSWGGPHRPACRRR